MLLVDSFKDKGLRKKLVEQLKDKGISDQQVLAVIEKIPRHFFLDSSFSEIAYQDKAFPIGSGQTISQPSTVAFQTSLLQIQKGEKVLEIGTGSGYQTSVLYEMGAKVFSIERQHDLFVKTKILLKELGYNTETLSYGDGFKGWKRRAPFDKIIVTAGAPEFPEMLFEQLETGGLMVVPVGVDDQIMHVYKKLNKVDYELNTHGNFRFVPMLKDKASSKKEK